MVGVCGGPLVMAALRSLIHTPAHTLAHTCIHTYMNAHTHTYKNKSTPFLQRACILAFHNLVLVLVFDL